MTGTLCGKCQDGKGLSVLLNRCKSCSKFNLLLIPALGIYIAHNYYQGENGSDHSDDPDNSSHLGRCL